MHHSKKTNCAYFSSGMESSPKCTNLTKSVILQRSSRWMQKGKNMDKMCVCACTCACTCTHTHMRTNISTSSLTCSMETELSMTVWLTNSQEATRWTLSWFLKIKQIVKINPQNLLGSQLSISWNIFNTMKSSKVVYSLEYGIKLVCGSSDQQATKAYQTSSKSNRNFERYLAQSFLFYCISVTPKHHKGHWN